MIAVVTRYWALWVFAGCILWGTLVYSVRLRPGECVESVKIISQNDSLLECPSPARVETNVLNVPGEMVVRCVCPEAAAVAGKK